MKQTSFRTTTIVISIVIMIIIGILSWWLYKQRRETYDNKVINEPKGLIQRKYKTDERSLIRDYVFEPIDIMFADTRNVEDYFIKYADDYTDFNERVIDTTEQYLDRQNVHDTYVQRHIRRLFADTKNSATNSGDKNVVGEILQASENLPSEKKEVIKAVISELQDRNEHLLSLNENEMDVLKTVWSKGDDNVKAQVLNALYDSYEDDAVVCPTGVATRIVDASNINNVCSGSKSKTKEVILDEMFTMAANLREKSESLGEQTEGVQFQKKLLEEYAKAYSGILSLDDIHDFTKDWINTV